MSSKAVNRRLVHTREIKTQAFARDDGLWDLEASLIDTKAKDFPLASGVRPAGDAIHHMFLLVTIDERFNIVAAQARTESMPYPGYCNRIEPEYQKLPRNGSAQRPWYRKNVDPERYLRPSHARRGHDPPDAMLRPLDARGLRSGRCWFYGPSLPSAVG